jgi:hypothetical protein
MKASMTTDLTITDRAVLLMLVTMGGEADAQALTGALGEPCGDSLQRLEADRLVLTGPTEAGGTGHELTDCGWYWCGQELHAGMPENVDLDAEPMAGALYAVLGLIGRYLDANDMALGELVLTARSRRA